MTDTTTDTPRIYVVETRCNDETKLWGPFENRDSAEHWASHFEHSGVRLVSPCDKGCFQSNTLKNTVQIWTSVLSREMGYRPNFEIPYVTEDGRQKALELAHDYLIALKWRVKR
jgi:hypothetical protein